MEAVSTVLIGLIVPAVVEIVKRIQSIPVSAGQTNRIRVVALVFAFLGNLGTAYVSGDLSTFLSPELITVGVQAVVAFGISHLTYHIAKVSTG